MKDKYNISYFYIDDKYRNFMRLQGLLYIFIISLYLNNKFDIGTISHNISTTNFIYVIYMVEVALFIRRCAYQVVADVFY